MKTEPTLWGIDPGTPWSIIISASILSGLLLTILLTMWNRWARLREEMAEVRRLVPDLIREAREPSRQRWNNDGTAVEFIYLLLGKAKGEPSHLVWLRYCITQRNGSFVSVCHVRNLEPCHLAWVRLIAKEFKRQGWFSTIVECRQQPDLSELSAPDEDDSSFLFADD